MDRLRGTGKTFSTSNKRWLPFGYDPKHAKKMARLHRLKAKGLTPATDKASLREAADEAIADFRKREVGTDRGGKRSDARAVSGSRREGK
jgi:hypothetical protein